MHTFIVADAVAQSVSTTDGVSTSDHAYLVMEQVREVVWFVSHRLPLGRVSYLLTGIWHGTA